MAAAQRGRRHIDKGAGGRGGWRGPAVSAYNGLGMRGDRAGLFIMATTLLCHLAPTSGGEGRLARYERWRAFWRDSAEDGWY